MTETAYQQCINPDCRSTHAIETVLVSCPKCGDLLDTVYDWPRLQIPSTLEEFSSRAGQRGFSGAKALNFSGVWRFRDLLPFWRTPSDIVTIGEGQTVLQQANLLAPMVGMQPGSLFLEYEGLNPSGSFKDNGMAAAFTHARMVGATKVACASTGNTSASLALYASMAGFKAVVFIGTGKIAFGKLSQALDYGAMTLQVKGDFDACLRRVREIAENRKELGLYLMNSVNPFRLEGQKTIMYRVLESLNWEVPDWIVVPGGNLGNCSAFGKAFTELRELGLIRKTPRLLVVTAEGANTLNELVTNQGLKWNGGRYDRAKIDALYARFDREHYHPHTLASAIEISRPVNLPKALRALDAMNGLVCQVSENEILEHRAMVARTGFGCEPASAASVAGLHQMREKGVIAGDEKVVCILTGHELKDPDCTVMYHTGIDTKKGQDLAPRREPTGRLTNRPIQVEDDLEAIIKAISSNS